MIKITDIKNPNGSVRNIYYSKGINRLDYYDDNVFSILSLGKYNEDLGNVKLILDGEEFSSDNKTSKILNFITVNVSKITSFKAIFIAEKENKVNIFEAFKEKLLPLKEIGVNNQEEAINKLTNAVKCVLSLNPTYLIFDANAEGEYSSILSDVVSGFISSCPYIFIKDKKYERLVIKQPVKTTRSTNNKKKSKPVKQYSGPKDNPLKTLVPYLKDNVLYLISDLLFAFGSTFSLFGIIYFIYNWDLTIFIIFSVIFLLFVIPFGDSMYHLFADKYRDDTKLFPQITSLIIFSILGYALAMGLSFIFASIPFFYEMKNVPKLSIILGFANIAALFIEGAVCFFIGKHKGLKAKDKKEKKDLLKAQKENKQ